MLSLNRSGVGVDEATGGVLDPHGLVSHQEA
jgi:hypothetical protein